MAGYTKLFSSILDSTVWDYEPNIKLVWITMLAMADLDGIVEASIPGLAKRAGVPLPDAERALEVFLGPDAYSRTKLHDGRRIEVVDGGWRLLNHEAYKHRATLEEYRQKAAERQRRKREREAKAEAATSRDSNVSSRSVTRGNDTLSETLTLTQNQTSTENRLVASAMSTPPPICFLSPTPSEEARLLEIQTKALPEVEAVEYWKLKAGVTPRSADVVKTYVARARKRLSEGLTLEQLKGAVDGSLSDDFWRVKAKDPVVVWKDYGRVLELDGLRLGLKPVRGKSYMTEPGALVTETAASEDMEHVRKLQAEFRQREQERAARKAKS